MDIFTISMVELVPLTLYLNDNNLLSFLFLESFFLIEEWLVTNWDLELSFLLYDITAQSVSALGNGCRVRKPWTG